MAYTGPILPPVVEKEEKEKPDMGQPHASKPSIPLFMEVEGRLVELVGTLPKRRVKKLQYGEKNIFLAGPDSECSPEAFEDHICAQTISLYPVNKHANTRLGDPICDRFAVQLYENRVIATVADGCNWGPKPRDAAKAASKAFVNYMRSHQNIVREASDACILLLRAISEAHTRVVSGKEETWWECGTTTICGGILLELEEVENDPFNWAFICASVGDCKAFRYSAGSNKITDITRGNRTNLTDAQDCGGRIGPFKNGQPDLRNLNFYYQNCRVGDMILIVSDGVHDNLDPMNFGLPPSTAAPGILGKDSYSDWDTLNDDQIEEIKAQYMRRKVEVDLLGKEMQTPSVMVERLLDHAKQSTHASRTFMEENPEKKQPHDYILYPGKMDHTTCVCFRVGLNYPSKPTAKAQARVAPSALVSETADPLSEDMDHFLRSLTGQAGEPLLDSSTCHGCHQAIEEGAQVVWANCYPYHSDHFKCVMCGVGLAGSFFHPKGTDVACEKCIDKEARGHICAACRKPLKARRSIHALGMFWHPEHFKCSKCGMHLEGEGGFFEHAGDLYCQADHKLINAEKDLCFDGEDDLVDLPPQSTEEKAASKKAEEKGSKKAQRSARDDSGADSARKASSGSMSARRKGSVRATASGPLARSVSLVGKGFTTPSSENFPRRRPTPGASLLSSSPQSPALQSDVCPHCNKRVKSGGVVVMGRRYHKDHLRCTACKVHLSDGYFVRDSELFCESHYSAAKPSFAEDRLLADIKADRRMSSPNLSGMLKRQRKGSAGERDAKI